MMEAEHTTDRTTHSPPRRSTIPRREATLLAVGIMGAAVTGYFVGLSSPMNPHETVVAPAELQIEIPAADDVLVIPATSYASMSQAAKSPNHDWTTRLDMLKQDAYDPLAEIQINQSEKLASLASRAELRAFNGAPPTIPHAVGEMTAYGCMACHGQGLRAASVRATKMPHPFYVNCMQCHVVNNPRVFAPTTFRDNSFVGLAAPHGGERAFANAPPVLPHSTWMRDDCRACHGRTASPGMETTHAWRENCLQCHATSALLDQTGLNPTPQFLAPPSIEEHDESKATTDAP